MDAYSFFVAYLGLIAIEGMIKLYDAIRSFRRKAVEKVVSEAAKRGIKSEKIREIEEKWSL